MDERFDRVEGELKASIGELRTEMQATAGELRTEIKAVGKELRGEIVGGETRLDARLTENYVRVREEIAKLHNDNQQIHAEMHALHRTIVQISAGAAATLVVTVVGLLIAKL
jgi:hypothetical protein